MQGFRKRGLWRGEAKETHTPRGNRDGMMVFVLFLLAIPRNTSPYYGYNVSRNRVHRFLWEATFTKHQGTITRRS